MNSEKELGEIFYETGLPIALALWPKMKREKWAEVPAEDRNFFNQTLAAFLKVMQPAPDSAGSTGMARDDLPEVGGRRLTTSIADFEQKCQVTLGDLQQNHFADTHLIGLLCEAVRLSREHVDYVRDHIGWMPNPALPVASSQPSAPTTTTKPEEKIHFGKDCPKGMVQVEFVGHDPSNRQGKYGWKPEKSVFLEIYVDGKRFRIDVGNCVAGDGSIRRGLHICGPMNLKVDNHYLNALDVFFDSEPQPTESRDTTGGAA